MQNGSHTYVIKKITGKMVEVLRETYEFLNIAMEQEERALENFK